MAKIQSESRKLTGAFRLPVRSILEKIMRKLALAIIILATAGMFYRINRYPISFSIYEGLIARSAARVIEGDKNQIKQIWEKPIRNQSGCSAGIGSAENNPFLIYPTVFFLWNSSDTAAII